MADDTLILWDRICLCGDTHTRTPLSLNRKVSQSFPVLIHDATHRGFIYTVYISTYIHPSHTLTVVLSCPMWPPVMCVVTSSLPHTFGPTHIDLHPISMWTRSVTDSLSDSNRTPLLSLLLPFHLLALLSPDHALIFHSLLSLLSLLFPPGFVPSRCG